MRQALHGRNPALHSEKSSRCLEQILLIEFWAKKSGLKVVTLIATLNPVSQVLW